MESQKQTDEGGKVRGITTSRSEFTTMPMQALIEGRDSSGEDGEDNSVLADQQEGMDAERLTTTRGLAVLLGQFVAYFSQRAKLDDLDVLTFCLYYLFCQVDFLFRKALPLLTETTAEAVREQGVIRDIRYRQHIWLQLTTINRTLDRMEPLCHLLSDAGERVLDTFDISNGAGEMQAGTAHLINEQKQKSTPAEGSGQTGQMSPVGRSEERSWRAGVDQERWERSYAAITTGLLSWQEQHHRLAPFTLQFAHLLPLAPSIARLDGAFATLLDSAGAIFGDILPAFRTLSATEESAITALLFDLMQQSDQLLVQFEATLEPLTCLIRQFAAGGLGG